ncbi:1-phosphofructokinase family hexose kinase [Schaalia suimastitidis]|uniref:1-phosphofructokinase family hexose kinase n=1 Tax=Schaalia suimastitidis TaxID=121163 RepID=UPI000411DC30|nr:PfkB family carbohydrate kinase [Schaalia suimastitidis]
MIWTITPNPALDITWHVPNWQPHRSHRITDIAENPGGKGLNVARVLDQLGYPVTVATFLGGGTGQRVASLLSERHPRIACQWVPVTQATRRSVAIVDADATLFNEAGATVPATAWEQLRDLVRTQVRYGDVVTICGSLPGDTPSGEVVALLSAAREAGAVTILDTSGPALVEAGPYADILKPNEAELIQATGATSLPDGVRSLHEAGASWVVLSRGTNGMELYAPCGAWRAHPGQVFDGNPTGAGDAAVAGLASVIAHTWQTVCGADGQTTADNSAQCAFDQHYAARDNQLMTPQVAGNDRHQLLADASLAQRALREAVAMSAAAVLRPTAGEIDTDIYQRLRQAVTAELLPQDVAERVKG